MAKYLSLLTSVFALLFVAAPLALADPVLTFSEHKSEFRDEKRKAVYFKTSYETAALKNAQAYPALDAALKRNFNEVRKKQITSTAAGAAYNCKEFLREVSKYYKNMVCFIEEKASVCRADDSVVSLSCSVTEYYGGPHHNTTVLGYSFDTLSGKALRLSDVVTDREALKELAAAQLKAEMAARDLEYLPETDKTLRDLLDGVASDRKPQPWTLDKEGLTLYFDPYIFAPYVYGRFDITIDYAGHKEIFAEKYLPAVKSEK